MSTNNELIEAAEAAMERCRSCLHSRWANDKAAFCGDSRKWFPPILKLNEIEVYPGDLYYIYDYYLPAREGETEIHLTTRQHEAHAMAARTPCPLYERATP